MGFQLWRESSKMTSLASLSRKGSCTFLLVSYSFWYGIVSVRRKFAWAFVLLGCQLCFITLPMALSEVFFCIGFSGRLCKFAKSVIQALRLKDMDGYWWSLFCGLHTWISLCCGLQTGRNRLPFRWSRMSRLYEMLDRTVRMTPHCALRFVWGY